MVITKTCIIIDLCLCCLVSQSLFEKIIANRLLSFLLKYDILCDHQFGFVPCKNATHAILSLVYYLINSFEDNKLTCGIFLDISRAFNTIDHNILLSKLYKYGIRGNMLNWFMSYLYNRYHFVSINNTSSSFLRIKCGVAQVSILGPIHFLLYINDLPWVSTKLRSSCLQVDQLKQTSQKKGSFFMLMITTFFMKILIQKP